MFLDATIVRARAQNVQCILCECVCVSICAAWHKPPPAPTCSNRAGDIVRGKGTHHRQHTNTHAQERIVKTYARARVGGPQRSCLAFYYRARTVVVVVGVVVSALPRVRCAFINIRVAYGRARSWCALTCCYCTSARARQSDGLLRCASRHILRL